MISLHKPLFTYFTVLFKNLTFYHPSIEEVVDPYIFPITYMLDYMYLPKCPQTQPYSHLHSHTDKHILHTFYCYHYNYILFYLRYPNPLIIIPFTYIC